MVRTALAAKAELEHSACALCGTGDHPTACVARDWLHGSGEEFRYVRCAGCGLVYLDPRPTPAAIGRYYPRTTYYTFQAPDGASVIRPEHRRRARDLTTGRPPGRVFDVGCGDGSFMLALRAEGWRPTGVEYDAQLVERLRAAHQLEVLAGDFVTMPLPQGGYDLVTMLEALEHLHQPLAALRRARGLLRPGGEFCVTVPNIAGLEYRLFGADWVALEPPLHLYQFSPQTLTAILRAAGFDSIRLRHTASTAGLTRSLWLKLRRTPSTDGRAAPAYHARSWRRTAHQLVNAALWPAGQALAALRLGPGLIATARNPG